MRRPALALLFLACFATAAQAGAICDQLGAQVAAARTGVPGGAALRLPGADCGPTRTLDGPGWVCAWAHPYRSAAARDGFAALGSAIRACIGDVAEPEPARGVNHPDTHEVRAYRLPSARVSVALKDKVAQGLSYVFLRVDPVR